jgi:hypothetical protein
MAKKQSKPKPKEKVIGIEDISFPSTTLMEGEDITLVGDPEGEPTEIKFDEKEKKADAPPKSSNQAKKEGKKAKSTTKDEHLDEIPNEFLPKKDLYLIQEAAMFLDVHPDTIRNWVDHGHLTMIKKMGICRITRDSLLKCRFRSVNIGSSRI